MEYEVRFEVIIVYIPEFFRRCPSSQSSKPMLQFAK